MGGFVEECVIVFLNNFRTLSLNRDKSLITHRSSGRKYDCWTRGLLLGLFRIRKNSQW